MECSGDRVLRKEWYRSVKMANLMPPMSFDLFSITLIFSVVLCLADPSIWPSSSPLVSITLTASITSKSHIANDIFLFSGLHHRCDRLTLTPITQRPSRTKTRLVLCHFCYQVIISYYYSFVSNILHYY